jgi:thiosulfate dehydrogenase
MNNRLDPIIFNQREAYMNKKRAASLLGAGVVFLTGLVVWPGTLFADEDEMEWTLMRGGLLYDRWYKVIGERAPGEKHPLYPADGKYASKPGATWRCKECHGWDYNGKDGAYAKGKHFTGIKGIRGMDGGDPGKVVALLKGDHGYGDKLEDADLQALALFVTKGQTDMGQYIDSSSKMPKGGDAAKGAAYYNTMCSKCHGLDGTEPEDMSKSLGKQMGNPWEVMHKIQNGQPDEEMPALRALEPQVTVDIMAHIATLPKKP